jgi:hypothetical protein
MGNGKWEMGNGKWEMMGMMGVMEIVKGWDIPATTTKTSRR